MTLEVLLFAVAAFFLGAIPFSLVIGFVFLRVDIRDYCDGNPGASNVIRAGSLKYGILALMLDISKGAAPVGLAAQVFDITGWPLVLITLAPTFGHAFSPLLGFRGGKAIATTSGMMIGLSLLELPLVSLPLLVFWFYILTSSGWAVMFTLASLFVYLFATHAPQEWLYIFAVITVLMVYKHRAELIQPPRLRLFSKQTESPTKAL